MDGGGADIMSDKLITIEAQDGPFQSVFQRIMRMVPDRDKNDINLQRLRAFRLPTSRHSAFRLRISNLHLELNFSFSF